MIYQEEPAEAASRIEAAPAASYTAAERMQEIRNSKDD
jgi:hypothetical protein